MPIQILPPQLVKQIAAGEIVERPASVVKELVENSIDAGATRIDIDIEHGGAKSIRIRDNGCGIKKDELALALARHATSKIALLEDLEAIFSLGFRGEALTSISSVSRLTLTSRTADQQEAWQVYTEGRDIDIKVKPTAHPVGTTLEVLDLFYNTPARRKFMRTEKTEFGHIDEIIRRIALARFDIAINLSHNGKMMRQYRAIPKWGQKEHRLGSICGATFLEQALAIKQQYGDLTIRGWVVVPKAISLAPIEIQYCYVNERIVHNRLINHAIRQAYEEQLGADQQPAFVLYLKLDPHQVDVNVHPAKQEVRFHQSRLVHDLIYQSVLNALLQQAKTMLTLTKIPAAKISERRNQFAAPTVVSPSHNTQLVYRKQQGAIYKKLLASPAVEREPTQAVPDTSALEDHHQSFGRVLTIIAPDTVLLERNGTTLALLALPVAERWLRQAQLTPGSYQTCIQTLLIPVRIKVTPHELAVTQRYQDSLAVMGIKVALEAQHVILRAVPLPLYQQNLPNLIPELISYLAQKSAFDAADTALWIASYLACDHKSWNIAQAITVLAEVERLYPQLVKDPPGNLLQPIDLQIAINNLKHECNNQGSA